MTTTPQTATRQLPRALTLASAATITALLVLGCAGTKVERTATDIPTEQATPEYWWDKPAPTRVPADDFDRAFDACQRAARDKSFVVAVADARTGTVITSPLTASQWFEPWMQDNTTSGDVARASLATLRRTVRFDILKTPDGKFAIAPKVLVERQTVVGRRVSGVVGANTFTAIDQSSLTAQTPEGNAPPTYWYAVGRDYNLEVELGNKVIDEMYH
jgi:hypothetical protein